ncbi:hypothetical protein JKA74_15165 [Marivirga sp. S37H4]|uniref:Lipoprotein n=1 Tax=Marivirga aurantiaca TaxID=2802615 RepID=A0A935CCX5_9BACT|nr:hypothetical protein [Marivirga aurantiaca]MBK6266383.1 hypothetical protein [Marivirga aurantiaca]
MKKTITIIMISWVMMFGCNPSNKKDSSNESIAKMDSAITEVKPKKVDKTPVVETDIVNKSTKTPEGRCDISVILQTSESIENLTNEDIYKFLFTFSEDCKNNIEFGEFSNEVLFEVLLRYPLEISNNLKKDSIYQDIILNEIANPIMEMQSADEIINNVNSLEIPEQTKQDVISSYKISIGYK